MAFNNGFPMNYPQMGFYQQPLTSQVPQVNTQPVQQSNNASPIWVQGEAGAKSYLVAPNNSVMLMDSEGAYFYMKSADPSGMPITKKYAYQEVEMGATVPKQTMPDLSAYVKKDELNDLITSFLKKEDR